MLYDLCIVLSNFLRKPSTCFLYLNSITSFLKGHSPTFTAQVTYLLRLLPKNTIFLFVLFPKSTMLFNLEIWEEKVVTKIAEFVCLTLENASSTMFLAILSLGVLRSTPE